MKAARRIAAETLAATVVVAGLLTIVGVLVAHFGHVHTKGAVAYALWIGGAIMVFIAGGSGSTSRMTAESRIVVGGRFAGATPLPQTPFQFVIAGLLTVGIGVLVFLYG